MAPVNKAAWLKSRNQHPFVVEEAPMPEPGEGELVIRNHAVAIIPFDYKLQSGPNESAMIKNYPTILGGESAGVVAAVHPSVADRFSVGDRVLAASDSSLNGKADHGAFALYMVANATLTARLPAGVSFADAAVLPVAVTTAAAGLHQKLGLPLPGPNAPNAEGKGRVVLIWGGASSVGLTTIQMAKASGLRVVTTASGKNEALCRSLGAEWVFDYNDADVVAKIAAAVDGAGTGFAGAFAAISTADSLKACGAVCAKVSGKKMVIRTDPSLGDPSLVPEGVEADFVFAASLVFDPVGAAVWRDYLPLALEAGTLKCKPDPVVVGRSLEEVQAGVDRIARGVSAQKLVVELA